MGSPIDLSGKRFGRLLVISEADKRRLPCGQSLRWWHCVCDCGTNTEVQGRMLRDGLTQSCGCLHNELVGAMMRTHGLSKTRTYSIWEGMIKRCTNPNRDEYSRYGPLGVCDEFRTFEGFYAHVGEAPDGLSIERIDNTKGYLVGNVKWATYTEQGRNKLNNRLMTFRGETRCQAEWCQLLGLRPGMVNNRLRYGWTDEAALATPKRVPQPKRQRGIPNGLKTHCPSGHEYTAANTYIQKCSGGRMCRACNREYVRLKRLA